MRVKKQKYRITSISSQDPFYRHREAFIGRTCVLNHPKHRLTESNGWLIGVTLYIESLDIPESNNSGFYSFFKVKLVKI